MYLRPVGQCAIRVSEDMTETDTLEEEQQSELPQGEPIVALLDGLPLTGHQLLDGRLIIDDPDGYESDYQAQERVHGTGMASLICHGDLNADEKPSGRPLYVRPIMQPRRGFDGQSAESIPEGILPVDLVRRAVQRMYDSEGGEPPIAPSVRVINLSVCDRTRPFLGKISSQARLLDWLAWRYNVLFIVSAGNHDDDIKLDIPRADLSILTADDLEKAVIKAIAADTRNRRLLSPAETLNGLTLAATHADTSPPSPNLRHIDPFTRTGTAKRDQRSWAGIPAQYQARHTSSGGAAAPLRKTGEHPYQRYLENHVLQPSSWTKCRCPWCSGSTESNVAYARYQ